MRTEQRTTNDNAVTVLCSRRFQDGVEIVEREIHYVAQDDAQLEQAPSHTGPRLVIDDNASTVTEFFVSKTRAEVEGLSSLLNNLIRRPLQSK